MPFLRNAVFLLLVWLTFAATAARAAERAPTGAPAGAEPPPIMATPPELAGNTREAICLIVESAAISHGLPLEFFARVIWQESRFRSDAVGPVTRNGERAQGMAQFMPATATERRLLDPFDPVQALPKSAEFLSELRGRFGNLGLAAAAYNAGPRRVQEWLDGTGPMPQETRNYVSAITGASVEDWAGAARRGEDSTPARAPGPNCRDLMALLRRAPNPFVSQLEVRVARSEAKPWGVQLAAGFSRDRALSSYARSIKRIGSLIRDRDPTLFRTVLRSRGTRPFYQARIGADTRSVADTLCGLIRKAGEACIVLRNRIAYATN